MFKLNKLSGMRSFLLLWSAQAISLMGSEMTNFALTVHVYGAEGTATSVALLRVFYVMPSILLCFAAGALADRWDKKKVILAGILAGALATSAMLVLSGAGALNTRYLYAINFTVSFVNAFVGPAIYVAVTLLSPKEQYVRVSGLQLLSMAVAKVAAPVLAAGVLRLGGIQSVFMLDLATFAAAFFIVLLFVKIPPVPGGVETTETFIKSCLTGLSFLREHKAVRKCIIYLAAINLLANLGGDGSMMPSMVLARTGGNELTLSAVTSAAGIGALIGSIAVTAARAAKSKSRVMFLACAASFLICDFSYAFGQSVMVWAIGALLGNVLVPFISANNVAIMRSNVPVSLQGRVFALRDTLQFLPIPIGLYLGGFMADHVFEPLMRAGSPLQSTLSTLVGTGQGSGMAVIMMMTGVAGCTISLVSSRNPIYRQLD